MKKTIETVIAIEDITHEGKGVGRHEGKTVFVDGAIPGERVRAQIYKQRKSHDEAKTLQVLEASPDRGEPPCHLYGVCGGCGWQHLHPVRQIQLKEHILVENLSRIGKVHAMEVVPPMTGHHLGYRRRARLGAKYDRKKSKFYLGFREKFQSRYITPVDHCMTLHMEVSLKIPEIARIMADLDCYDQLPQVEVAVGDATVALVFRHLVPLSEHDRALLASLGQEQGWQIYTQSKGPDTVKPLWPLEPPAMYYSLAEYDLKLEFEPLDFIQVNAEMNEKLISRAIEWLDLQPGERVLDLFCGLGNFSLAMARHGAVVYGVEGDQGLVRRAQKNAVLNAVPNTRFGIADLTVAHDFPEVDKVLIDPPRTGALGALESIARLGVQTIVYVSCNPATLARDAGILVHEYGYQLEKAGVFDMFPHTNHVESMALFKLENDSDTKKRQL